MNGPHIAAPASTPTFGRHRLTRETILALAALELFVHGLRDDSLMPSMTAAPNMCLG
jgi:hypothetical protein